MLTLIEVLKVLDTLNPKSPVAGVTILMDDMFFQWIEIPDGKSMLTAVKTKFSKLRKAEDDVLLPVNSIRVTKRWYFRKHGHLLGRETLYSINLRAHRFPVSSPFTNPLNVEHYTGGVYTAPWYR